MPRLKDRNKQTPGGHFFFQPETRWRSTEWSSFDSIVDQVIAHRNGNPAVGARVKWKTDRPSVESEVDNFIANVCVQMGWSQYVITAEAPPPSLQPPTAQDLSQLAVVGQKVRNIWSGIKTLSDWVESGAPGVAQELADARAAVCVECPKNGAGDFTSWFVAPAAAALKRLVEKAQARNLRTANDEKLGTCEACMCPMKLKVHPPIDFIKTHTSDETMDKLRQAPVCWIVKELAG